MRSSVLKRVSKVRGNEAAVVSSSAAEMGHPGDRDIIVKSMDSGGQRASRQIWCRQCTGAIFSIKM